MYRSGFLGEMANLLVGIFFRLEFVSYAHLFEILAHSAESPRAQITVDNVKKADKRPEKPRTITAYARRGTVV